MALVCLAAVSCCGVLISAFSDGESRGVWLSAFLLIFVSVGATRYAARRGLIHSFSTWIFALTAYIILSYVVFIFFWYIPLVGLDSLRTATQLPEYQDANFYDYMAVVAARSPFSEWPGIINSTWLSQGVISYLGLIYKIFGISAFNFLNLNILLAYLSSLLLQSLIKSGQRAAGLAAIISPFSIYYFITPGKEVLTNFLVIAVLYLFYSRMSLKARLSFRVVIMFAGSLFLLIVVRVNAALMVVITLCLYVFFNSDKKLVLTTKVFVILAGFFSALLWLGFYEIIIMLLDFNLVVDGLNIRLENAGASGIKHALGTGLISDNLLIHAALAPLRAIVWVLAPLPIVDIYGLIEEVIYGSPYSVFRSGESLMRVLSSALMLWFVARFAFEFFVRGFNVFSGRRGFVLFCALCFVLILSSTQFIEGARYRTVVEPLALCWILSQRSRRSIPHFDRTVVLQSRARRKRS